LNRLNHGSGRGFIDLVKKPTFQDFDNIPTEFLTVPSAVYDQISAVPDANPHPGCLIAKKGGTAAAPIC
jgi:hypothetical protein